MIFTIGYSTRSLPEFLIELRRRGITQLWDVRSSPWSRNQPFNGSQIERWAGLAGVFYRQAGDVLGGRAEISLGDSRYLAALDLLLNSASREPLAIMCSEGDPTQCHRTWDIGASLLVRYGVVARSILRDGREEDVTDTIARTPPCRFAPELLKRLSSQPDLF
jgi:uncharacterized protein (DUF488 family)